MKRHRKIIFIIVAVAIICCIIVCYWIWQSNVDRKVRNLVYEAAGCETPFEQELEKWKLGFLISQTREEYIVRGELYKMGEVAIPELANMLNDQNEPVRRAASYLMRYFASHYNINDKVLNTLIYAMLNDKSEAVRGNAVDAIGMSHNKDAVDSLLKALSQEKEESIRCGIIYALGEIGDQKGVETTIILLKNEYSCRVRMYCAYALGKMGDKRAIDMLIKILKEDPDGQTRINSARSLGELGDRKAIDPLIQAFCNDSDASVQAQAAESLSILGFIPGDKSESATKSSEYMDKKE